MISRTLVIRSVAVTVAVVIGGWAITLLWPQWVAQRDRSPPPPDTASESSAPATAAPALASDPKISVLGTDASISEKPLQLVLVSTEVGQLPEQSRARLGADSRNPQTYGVGSILSNGAVIAEIYADRVVVVYKGRHVPLMVDASAAARLAMHDSLAESGKASSTVLESLQPVTGSDPATSVGGRTPHEPDRVPTSRDNLSEIMRAQPVFERDRYTGLQLFRGSRASALEQLGLKEGDIVRTVAGDPVNGENAWQAIDDAVSTGTPILIGIEREGNLMSVSLDSTQLANPSLPQS